jgi:transcriptional regulator of nitric oxide reductase
MTTQEIFDKYFQALKHASLAEGNISRSTIAMALHLAIEEAALTGVPESALVAAQNEAAMLRQQRATAHQEIDTLRQHLADAIKLISALQGDVRLLRQQVAEARTERDRQKFKVIGLRAAVAEQPHYEEQQNRLMRWLIDNEPTASLDIKGNLDVASIIIAVLERQRPASA